MLWTIRILFMLGLFSVGFGSAWKIHDWKDAAGELKAVRQVVATVQAQGTVNTRAVANEVAAQDRIVWRTRTLREKVHAYVTPQADRGCTVTAGFVQLHDRAALGQGLPAAGEPAAGAADAPSGVALSAVGDTVTANYGICWQYIQRTRDLTDWIDAQAAASRGKPPP